MAVHRVSGRFGPRDPEPALQDVLDEVDRVDQKLNQVLTQLEQIRETLKEVSSVVADVQDTLNSPG